MKKDTRFKKGQSGNPNGRPKGTFSLVGILKQKLQEVPAGKKKTYAEMLVDRYLKQAIGEGNDKLIRDALDRVDGRPDQKQQHTVKADVDMTPADAIKILNSIKSD